MRTRLTDLIGIEVPIVQAPMAGCNGADLAVAVAQAGGLGSLPTALFDAAGMREEMRSIRDRTSAPINLNFFCHTEPEVTMPVPHGAVARLARRLLRRARHRAAGAGDRERRTFGVRCGDVRDRRGAAARGRQLPFRSARGVPGHARAGDWGRSLLVRHHGGGGPLARRAGMRRRDRPGCRGGRPPRHVPHRRRLPPGGHDGARPAGSRCRGGARDRRRRDR